MHYMDVDYACGEKVRQELRKNATSYIEQILEAIPLETVAEQPPTHRL